jgi:predicted DNA-binding transcriptional regulator YafY
MRRADRLFEIIQILRRERKPVSSQRIAEELETSKRTIYRDIATLIAQRVPVIGEPGIGYVLADGFDMPPLMLSVDEIDAAVLGALWVSTRGESELARAAKSLIAKIEAVIPERLRTSIMEPPTSVAPVSAPPNEVVRASEIRAAIRSRHKIAITYAVTDGGVTERVVWPILLGYREAGRILAAWCELRGDFRYFRTDRMMAARVLDDSVPERLAVLRTRWRQAMAVERGAYEAKRQN